MRQGSHGVLSQSHPVFTRAYCQFDQRKAYDMTIVSEHVKTPFIYTTRTSCAGARVVHFTNDHLSLHRPSKHTHTRRRYNIYLPKCPAVLSPVTRLVKCFACARWPGRCGFSCVASTKVRRDMATRRGCSINVCVESHTPSPENFGRTWCDSWTQPREFNIVCRAPNCLPGIGLKNYKLLCSTLAPQ